VSCCHLCEEPSTNRSGRDVRIKHVDGDSCDVRGWLMLATLQAHGHNELLNRSVRERRIIHGYQGEWIPGSPVDWKPIYDRSTDDAHASATNGAADNTEESGYRRHKDSTEHAQ